MLKAHAVAVVIVLGSSACDPFPDAICENMNFSDLRAQNVTKVNVHSSNDQSEKSPIREMRDNAQTTQLVEYIVQREENWRVPALGVPVGKIRFVFWSNDQRLRRVTLGNNFLEAQGCGYFFIRSISPVEQTELLQLVGLPEDIVDPAP